MPFNNNQLPPEEFLKNFPQSVIQYFDDSKSKTSLARTKPELDIDYALSKQAEGCGVYFTPNSFTGGRRISENLTSINAVFIDLDVAKERHHLTQEDILAKKSNAEILLEAFDLKPHFVIETKNGLQVIWLVEQFSVAQFDETVNFLIAKFNADKGRKGVTGVLRLPGFKHLKDPEHPFSCELIKTHQEMPRYTPENFYKIIDFQAYLQDLTLSNQQLNIVAAEYDPSPEIQKAINVPLEMVLKVIPPMVGITVELESNADGSLQIVENGERTSGFISIFGNFADSSSDKNRKGNPITISKYYLNEIGGNYYTAQDIAKLILTYCDTTTEAETKNEDAASDYITAGELRMLDLERPKFLIEGLLPYQGLTMLSGLPGSYKTWLYTHFIASIIKGLPALGEYTTTPVNILLINVDDSTWEIQERLNLAQISDDQENILIIRTKPTFKIDDSDDKESLIKAVEKWNIGLVIVDTLRQSHDRDENDSRDMNTVMAAYKEVIRKADCAILLVHHDSKDYSGKTSITAPSGSVTIIGNCIASIRMRKGEQQGQVILEGGKNKLGQVIKKTNLQFDASKPGEYMFTQVQPKAPASIMELKASILQYYYQNPNPGLIKDEFIKEYIGTHGGTSKSILEKAFAELESEGLLAYITGRNNRKEFHLVEKSSDSE